MKTDALKMQAKKTHAPKRDHVMPGFSRRAAALLVLLVALACPRGALADAGHGAADDALLAVDPIMAALGAFCDVPSAEALLAADPDAADRLYAVAIDASQTEYVRQRAVSLLSHFPTAETEQRLALLMEIGPVRQRALAVYTHGRTFGALVPELALERLLPHLDSADPRVRDFAIRALGWVESAEARAALGRIEQSAPTDAVRRLARHVLARPALDR